MLYLAVAVVAFVVGFAVAGAGVWFRFARMEGRLRNLRTWMWDEAVLMHDDLIPVEWVSSEIDMILKEEFG